MATKVREVTWTESVSRRRRTEFTTSKLKLGVRMWSQEPNPKNEWASFVATVTISL